MRLKFEIYASNSEEVKSSALIHMVSQTTQPNCFLSFFSLQKNVFLNPSIAMYMTGHKVYTTIIMCPVYKSGTYVVNVAHGSSAVSCRPFFSEKKHSCDSLLLQQPSLCTIELEP